MPQKVVGLARSREILLHDPVVSTAELVLAHERPNVFANRAVKA